MHVVCSEGAVPILKNYSPELIVLPHYLDRNDSVDHIMSWMNRMHSVLIGRFTLVLIGRFTLVLDSENFIAHPKGLLEHEHIAL